MSKQLKLTMETLEARRLHPAMRRQEDIDAAAADKKNPVELHPLVLYPTQNSHELIYIHPQRLLDELEKRGEFLNLLTMEFEKKAETTQEPAPAPEQAPEVPAEPEKDKAVEAEEQDAPEPTQVYSETELKEMSKKDLLHIAGIDPDVNTKGVKAELIEKLAGRPKFPLE